MLGISLSVLKAMPFNFCVNFYFEVFAFYTTVNSVF